MVKTITMELLKIAKEKYPKGSLFLSATNNLKSPLKVHSLRVAENYNNTVVDIEGGVIFTEGVWAQKIN